MLKVIDLREISSYTELVFRFLCLSLILFRFLVLILILQGYEYALYSQLPLITMSKDSFLEFSSVCLEVSAVDEISDCQPGGSGFNPRPGRGLNFERPSFATPSVDRDVKLLVWSLDVLSGDLKEPTHLSIT